MSIIEKLAEEFPKEAVSWRAQNVKSDGTSALALAYIDARDVMRRLDEAVGPENWQDSYSETPRGRVICSISVRLGPDWISKSDGAGETDVEGEKGAISDAFKRAAVKWGIGRYLYDLDAPWVPCESYDAGGKKRWKRWTDNPWNYVKAKSPFENAKRRDEWHSNIKINLESAESLEELDQIMTHMVPMAERMKAGFDQLDAITLDDLRGVYKRCRAKYAPLKPGDVR
jgi:hypothetical protein